ncbi:MAG TPA: TIGR02757 family protein [Bacteroidales bacterium]|nr:MAG: TIGR02757 family protein [Bacteroidetes bacterium GWF2_33_38]OFY73890.1 MAG: TIGR02757 family protein [Bacteroidetes bacterium RIFOXYA12_FULL_33_9]HBF88388.1 TIGR02757 family protein [Bacteroidales bacterium]
MLAKHSDLKNFLDLKAEQYNKPSFINTDPICIPHKFRAKEDIEISAFMSATIAWGQRKTIIQNANKIVLLMDDKPYDFIMHASAKDLKSFSNFVHRTFNGDDIIFFLTSLMNIYRNHGGLYQIFEAEYKKNQSIPDALSALRNTFFEIPHLSRSTKHFSDVSKNSSAKRLNMFLRWLVRNDKTGVDFGIWNNISPSDLYIPLDVHSGNVARKLGLLKRTQNDWKAVNELTLKLREFDSHDPIKYDFALFGLGAFENF